MATTVLHHMVDFVAPSGSTYTALRYRNASGGSCGSAEVRFFTFFKDGIDPHTCERNFVQDDGSGSCPDEPIITMCGEMEPGVYAVYVKTIYFGDEDGSGNLSCGDTHLVVTSGPLHFELTDDPIIYKVKRTEVEPGEAVRIIGCNFGDIQGESIVNIGDKAFDSTSPRIKLWSDTKIKTKVPRYKCKWFKGQDSRRQKVWVTVDGVDSNEKRLRIIKPAACP